MEKEKPIEQIKKEGATELAIKTGYAENSQPYLDFTRDLMRLDVQSIVLLTAIANPPVANGE